MFGESTVNFSYYLVDVKRWTPENQKQLELFLPLAFHFDNMKNMEALLQLLEASIERISKLDETETVALSAFIYMITLQMANADHSLSPEQIEAEVSTFVSKEGGNMVSQLSRAIQKEIEGNKKREQKARLEGKLEGELEGKLEGMMEERKAFVLRLHKKGMTVAQIADLVSLPEDEIASLIAPQ